MKIKNKTWTALGLTGALIGTGLLASCSDHSDKGGDHETHDTPAYESTHTGEHGTAHTGEAGETGEGEGGEGHGDHGALPLEKRLAFMTGHVQAGLSLYRAGDPAAAAPHLLHPVSEMHAAEREGMDKLGFNAALFETVSKALEDGRPAAEIEPQLKAAEAHLSDLAVKANGNTVELIRYLMDTINEEYGVALTDGKVSDPGEYQDAFGFAVTAKAHAADLPESARTQVTQELDRLLNLWPAAPIPPQNPTPIGQVSAQTARVLLALPKE